MSETIWVAIITGCAAIIPNIIVAIINNHYQLKIRKIETTQSLQRQALKNFNEKATLNKHRVEYEQAVNELLIYFQNINTLFIQVLENSRAVQDWNTYFPEVRKTIVRLSKFIEK